MRRFGRLDRRAFVAGGLALPFLARTGFAQSADDGLEPGQYIWQPELSPEGPVVIVVSIPDQRVYVYRNGIEIGVSTCSTGRPGHTTPTGVFVILQKARQHTSSIYDEAMPNMERLTWGGIALHAGDLPGYPDSHGCVHLPLKFSADIFDITHLGVPVIIGNGKSQPETVLRPGFILPAAAEQEAAKAVAAAREKQAPAKITSGVISGADRKVIVLVNGNVTWESPITIADPDKPLGNTAYTLLGLSPDGSSFRWQAHSLDGSRVVLTGQDPVLSRITVEKAAEALKLLEGAQDGSVLVVTDRPAAADSRTAHGFVIVDAGTDDV